MLIVRKGPTSHLRLHRQTTTPDRQTDRHHRDPTNRNPWQDFYSVLLQGDRNLVWGHTLIRNFRPFFMACAVGQILCRWELITQDPSAQTQHCGRNLVPSRPPDDTSGGLTCAAGPQPHKRDPDLVPLGPLDHYGEVYAGYCGMFSVEGSR